MPLPEDDPTTKKPAFSSEKRGFDFNHSTAPSSDRDGMKLHIFQRITILELIKKILLLKELSRNFYRSYKNKLVSRDSGKKTEKAFGRHRLFLDLIK